MWITLQFSDIQKNLSPALLGVAEGYLAEGQADTANECLAEATSEIRKAVAANQQNVLGADGTIPDELRKEAGIIAAYEYATRLNISDKDILDVITKKHDAVQRAGGPLYRVRTGTDRIEPPTTASSTQVLKPIVKTVTKAPRQMTRNKMKGLL